MTTNSSILSRYILSLLLIITLISCEERNIHGDSLAKGSWKIIELENQDPTIIDTLQKLPGAHLAFNICKVSMNDDWETEHEEYGECSLVVSHQIENKLVQDEYRFHIRNEESLEIKLLPDHSDRVLPDLTGSYTYHIDGRNMVLRYTGTKKPELVDLEIHCWDWSPE